MSAAPDAAFKIGLVQMRSGLDPRANLATALAMIEEAARAGAAYVLTPEMTNIMEVKHERLFAAIVDEEVDATLAAVREAARRHSIYIHIGSLAVKVSPDRAANRSFVIDRRGDVVARYDKIHMFDVDLANGESYRESRNYRAGELAIHQNDALVAVLHRGQEFLHHPRLAEHGGEQIVQRAEIEVLVRQAEHRFAAFAVQRLHDDVAVLGAKRLDRFEIAGDQRRRHQLGKFGDKNFLRRIAHMGRIVDHERLRMNALEHVRRRDVGQIERRVLAQQHDVE